MARWSETNLSYLNDKERIDPEFFQKDFIVLDKILSKSYMVIQIAQTVDLQSNDAFQQVFQILNDNQPKTIPYIRSGNVGDFFLNKSDLHFISEIAHSKLTKTHTKMNDILMARKGKIGGATIIYDDESNLNSNDNVVNIRLHDERFIPEYFVAFWNSKFGLKQIERFATGNVQPWLSMKQIRQLKIVLVSEIEQKANRDIVLKAYKVKKQSISLYTQAQQLLEQELGLDKLAFEKPVGYGLSSVK
jgi:restriction endonuclease S subunit